MNRLARTLSLAVSLFVAFSAGGATGVDAQERKSFRLGYTIYVGFMPMAWMQQSGVMQKWADRYGIDVELIPVNDYIGSVNQFIAGDLDAVGIAGMDILTMPSAGGVDTSIFLLADYSNGNDAIISKSASSVADLVDEEVFLLQYSVSHYLLNRALVLNGIPGVGAVTTTNISDGEVAAAFVSQSGMEHAVSWKPMVSDMVGGVQGANVIFDSSSIPGEIMDAFVARTQTLADSPELAKAVTGAWYETLGELATEGPQAAAIREAMARAMGTDVAGLQSQMDTTFFFNTPAEAATFLTADETKAIWDDVRRFCFEQGLFGQGASDVDAIGIQFADESVLGNEGNIRLRIDPTFAQMAADGAL